MRRKIQYLILLILFYPADEAFLQPHPDTLTVVHITDTHICNFVNYHQALVSRRERYGNGFIPLKQFLCDFPKEHGADVIILTGDIIDFYEGEMPDGQMLPGNISYFSDLYKLCPVPLFMTLGNHDIASYFSNQKEKQSAIRINAHQAQAAWIRNFPCFEKGVYYYRDYDIGRTAYRFIFLNDSYKSADEEFGMIWDKEQLLWLDHVLSTSADRRVILFFHIPIPMIDVNQDGIAFEQPPSGWPFPDSYDKGIMKILNQYPSIQAMFVGHNHKNVIEEMRLQAGHVIVQIETAAFGQDANHWRIIQFTESAIIIRRTGGDGIEKRIPVEQISD